jgi:thiomorpholine-carboxylate dehydrogenase
VTVTSSREPVLAGEWLADEVLVVAVGANRPDWRELDDVAMRDVVVVDSREAAVRESGDVILSNAPIYAEAGEIIAGRKALPRGGRVVFKSLGLAVEDVFAAQLVLRAHEADAATRPFRAKG